MHVAQHLALKQTLWAKIKRLAALWGEGDRGWVQEYATCIYSEYMEDLQGAIDCFTGLVEQAIKIGRKIHDDTEVKNGRGIR